MVQLGIKMAPSHSLRMALLGRLPDFETMDTIEEEVEEDNLQESLEEVCNGNDENFIADKG